MKNIRPNNAVAASLLPVVFAGLLANTAFAADIDPFTGQNLAIEQTRAVLELTKQ